MVTLKEQPKIVVGRMEDDFPDTDSIATVGADGVSVIIFSEMGAGW